MARAAAGAGLKLVRWTADALPGVHAIRQAILPVLLIAQGVTEPPTVPPADPPAGPPADPPAGPPPRHPPRHPPSTIGRSRSCCRPLTPAPACRPATGARPHAQHHVAQTCRHRLCPAAADGGGLACGAVGLGPWPAACTGQAGGGDQRRQRHGAPVQQSGGGGRAQQRPAAATGHAAQVRGRRPGRRPGRQLGQLHQQLLPPGTRERPVANGTVHVLEAPPPAAAARAAAAAAPGQSPVAGPQPPTLRELAVERAVHSP